MSLRTLASRLFVGVIRALHGVRLDSCHLVLIPRVFRLYKSNHALLEVTIFPLAFTVFSIRFACVVIPSRKVCKPSISKDQKKYFPSLGSDCSAYQTLFNTMISKIAVCLAALAAQAISSPLALPKLTSRQNAVGACPTGSTKSSGACTSLTIYDSRMNW